MREPWHLSKKKIARLTDWDIVNLIMRPGDAAAAKKGYYWPLPDWDPDVVDDEFPQVGVTAEAPSFKAAVLGWYRDHAGMRDQAEMEARFHRDYPSYSRVKDGDGQADYPDAPCGGEGL